MPLEIKITGIHNVSTQTKVEMDKSGNQHLITKVSFESEISPSQLARILNLSRQAVVVNATIGTDQKAFDCLLVDQETGEIPTTVTISTDKKSVTVTDREFSEFVKGA